MIRSIHRADRLAWRVSAVLTEHGDEPNIYRSCLFGVDLLVEALEPNPGQIPAHSDLVLPNRGHIVLGLTRGDASRAAGALVQVDRHGPPGVRLGLVAAVARALEREVLRYAFSLDRNEATDRLQLVELGMLLFVDLSAFEGFECHGRCNGTVALVAGSLDRGEPGPLTRGLEGDSCRKMNQCAGGLLDL